MTLIGTQSLMQVKEIATKHGVSVQKVLALLQEAGIPGKGDTSNLNESEVRGVEGKLDLRTLRSGGSSGTVKVLRSGAGAPIIRRKAATRTVPKKTPKAPSETPLETPPGEEHEKSERPSAPRTETRRLTAESKARNLLRAKRLRESGIRRKSDVDAEAQEAIEQAEKAVAAIKPEPVIAKPVETVAPIEAKDPAVPAVEGGLETSSPELASASTPGVVADQKPIEPAPGAPAADDRGKRVKSKKQKREEIVEQRKERETRVQERKVLASIRGSKKGVQKQRYKRTKKERQAATEEAKREREVKESTTLRVHEATTVADVAHGIGVSAGEIVGHLLDLGRIVTVNQHLDREAIDLIAGEYGFEVEQASLMDINPFDGLEEEDNPAELEPRPPVITIMGHVDHGKTKLMDAIRSADVASGEAGGITQHIGAYYVHMDEGNICFLDTPGHEAFTAMRARGAMVTDVVVLVVAADDGVMPQTKEAIAHAKAASVPILVAINKIDLPTANLDNVKQQLAAEGLVPEDWGGNTPVAEISALQKVGIEHLLELIQIQAQLLELKANPNKAARGTILEARIEQGRGVIATALIQAGTLSLGDALVAGVFSGKTRALLDDHGKRVTESTPGMPVAILGLSGAPVAGDELRGVPDERTGRELAGKLQQIRRDREMARVGHVSLESLFDRIEEGLVKELNLVIKGDVQGSVEAVAESLEGIESEKVKIRILHRAAGDISESDIMLASASDAIILGFGVTMATEVAALREKEGVDVRTYSVIYDAIEDIRKAMLGLLEDEIHEVVLGHLEIVQIFRTSKSGLIVGGTVIDGKLVRDGKVRLIRDGEPISEAKLVSLRRFKEETDEVTEGLECGVGIEPPQTLREGDTLECYQLESMAATL